MDSHLVTANGHLLAFFPPDRARAVRDLLARVKIIGDYGGRDSHTAMSMADVIAETERLSGLCSYTFTRQISASLHLSTAAVS
jgi:hypothetical protein